MRKRDLSVLMLSAFAIFFSLQHEGDFSFREAWFHLSDEYPIKYEAERLPPPLVADLNGDGKNEVLVATHDAKIQLLEPHARRVDEGFSEARLLAEVSLLPDKIRVASGRRPVAMATGVIDRTFRNKPQKRVLVVVTSGWSVMCFNHNLKKLWENNLQNDFPLNAHHREIAVSISNHTLKHGDIGLVIVGGRMEMQPHMYIDPFEQIGMAERNAEQHRRSANEKEASENVGNLHLRHFSFYAFDGRKGALRWSRKNENIEEHSSDPSQLVPQHNYKLDVQALNSRQPDWDVNLLSEADMLGCKLAETVMDHNLKLRKDDIGIPVNKEQKVEIFSDAIWVGELTESLRVDLPMATACLFGGIHGEAKSSNSENQSLELLHIIGREDTLLKLSHFKRHKRKSLKRVPGKATTNPFHKPEEHHPPGKDETKRISNFIGKAAKYAGSAKSKKKIPFIPTIKNNTRLWWVPNVVVAHQKEGIEAVHLASGRTICKLHLQEGGLHADINGDGVLDHVQAVGANSAERTIISGSMEVLRPCWAVATSGVPVREQLFNASICHHSPFNLFQHGEFYTNLGRGANVASVEVATPILIPRSDGHRHWKGTHGDVIFLTSRGEVTAYSPGLHGHGAVWEWQLLTDATWSNLPSPSGIMEGGLVIPTLKPISLQVHDNQQMVLAAGEQAAVIISPAGSILASVDLPATPTHALITEDFSNDGLTDLILVTPTGVYGFVQTRQPGALFFSTLVGCLLLVMGVIFVSQHLNSTKAR
ncbi:hypothetical protein GQ457_06G039990 [Hibiscus cannabinus]